MKDLVIISIYDSNLTIEFEEYLKEKFKNKNIILCEDGWIEVLNENT